MRQKTWAALLGVMCAVLPAAAGAVDLDRYLRQESFTDIKLSPGGEYLAATLPMEQSTALAILRTSDLRMVGAFRPERHNHAHGFEWVSNERLLVSLAYKGGALDTPFPTGELFGINADGKDGDLLVGYRRLSQGKGRLAGMIAAVLADELASDDRNALIAVWPLVEDPVPQVERMDVVSGKRTLVVRAPVERATFTTDNSGEVRFALGVGKDHTDKLYHRVPGGEWHLLNDERLSERREVPLGFSADNSVAYLQVEQPSGPDAIVSWNPVTQARQTLLVDDMVDPHQLITLPGTRIPEGALYLGGTPRTRFFDENGSTARLYRRLERGLGGAVYVTSSTRDGGKVLVETWSGRNPGDFYLFDTVQKNARHVLSRSEWLDTDASAAVRPVALKARDGLPLHGFLTTPHGAPVGPLPTVVLLHGGPFGVFDDGHYDREAQMLAAAGYAVLQINFRGSANYGRAHTQAGRMQWGRAMQDDITDATRWAIEQGVADKARICTYGASYGAYAAMMGPVREPGLYRCAAGYVGVYDLPLMYARGDMQESDSGLAYLREWVGQPKELAEHSPVNLADRIGVPVFLAAGGADARAPIIQTHKMEAALKRAGTPVESLYYKDEGHGFHTLQHRREYYTQLLAFLSRSLGGAVASPSSTHVQAKGKHRAP
jgi:dipeptidyl aminopeptidase/acylaminoacyl peptidase